MLWLCLNLNENKTLHNKTKVELFCQSRGFDTGITPRSLNIRLLRYKYAFLGMHVLDLSSSHLFSAGT